MIGMLWLYCRWDHELSNDTRENSFQVGVMAQAPLNLIFR
jgi:hypothetical protein